MYKLLAGLLTGALMSVCGSVAAQVPKQTAVDASQAVKKEQPRKDTNGNSSASGKESKAQGQPSPSPSKAAFLVFLSLFLGGK